MALTITDIITAIKNNLVIQSEEKITNISRLAELEVMKNFAEEIKPSLFHNTDIGNIINSQIDILSYYLPDFLLDSINPITGFEYVNTKISNNTWIMNFNNTISQTINSTNLIPTYIELETVRKIENIRLELLPDTLYYIDDEYIYLSVWKVVWDYNGVESFDVYYKFGSNAEVLLYSDITKNKCDFILTANMISAFSTDDVVFIIKSNAEPSVILTTSVSFNINRVATGVETVVDKTIDRTNYTSIISGSTIILQKEGSLTYLPRDIQNIQIKKELIDENETNFNLNQDFNSYFITADKFRIDYININNNSINDPNRIIVRFNNPIKTGQILSSLFVLYGSDDGIVESSCGCIYTIVDNTQLIIDIFVSADSTYKYYRLFIGDLLDIYNRILSQSGEDFYFENNHGFVYHNNNIIVTEDNSIIVI